MKKIIEKYDEYCVLFVIAILSIIKIWNTTFLPYDNLWNFGNIYKLSIGKEMYKDINAVATPLFYKIGEYLYRLFSNNYIVYLIYGVILSTIMYFLIYKIIKKLQINKRISLFFTILIIGITINVVPYATNYVILSFTFFEIGVLLLLSNKNYNSLIQSLIVLLIFFTYQKLAVGYCITLILSQLLYKQEKKESITNLVKTAIISIMMTCVCIIYIDHKGLLNYFIDLCIGGIPDFTANVKVDFIFANILIAFVGIAIMFILVKRFKINKNNIVLLISSAIGSNIIVIPIVNEYHVRIGTIFWLIVIFYGIYSCLRDLVEDNRIVKIISITNIVFLIILFIKPIEHIDFDKAVIKKDGIFIR